MKTTTKCAAVLAGVVLALLGAEGALRAWTPTNVNSAGLALPLFRAENRGNTENVYELDPVLGFTPVLPSPLYAEHGARLNEYAREHPPGVRRVLFLGDSVTFRGRLIAALRARYGEAGLEYWNCGIEAYNTTQEVEYFARHMLASRPDEVVLTFHPNDFMTTPISFRTADGRMEVIAPARHALPIVPWLFHWSYLYRCWVGFTRSPGEEEAEHEIHAALVRLDALCREHGIALSVLVLPHLVPTAEWPDVHRSRRAWILSTLEELHLRRFDLLPAMERCLADGHAVQESPGDHDHPNDEVCAYFARALEGEGLLAPAPSASAPPKQ